MITTTTTAAAAIASAPTQQSSIYLYLKNFLAGYPTWLVDAGVFGVTGLVGGFLCKSFGKLFFMSLLIGAGILAALHYADIATINLVHLKAVLGITAVSTVDDALHLFIAWIQAHGIGCAIGVVGFLIGWKLG